jgi:hypothetical protein
VLCENCAKPATVWYVEASGARYLSCGRCHRGERPIKSEPVVRELADLGNRLSLSRTEAADALGISVDHFDRHVMPHLRIAQTGQRPLIPVEELRRFLDSNAARALKR